MFVIRPLLWCVGTVLAWTLLSPEKGLAENPDVSALPAGAVARLGTPRFGLGDNISALAYGRDGTTLIVVWGNRLAVIDVRTGRTVRAYKDAPFSPTSLAPAADGKIYAVGPVDKSPSKDRSPDDVVRYGEPSSICFGELISGKCLQRFTSVDHRVSGWTVSADAKNLASTAETTDLWNLRTGGKIRKLAGKVYDPDKEAPKDERSTWYLAFSADGKVLAVGGGHPLDDRNARVSIQLLEVTTGGLIRRFDGHQKMVTCLALSPDGRTLASSDFEENVRLWDVASGQKLRGLKRPGGKVTALAFSPDSKTLALAWSGGVHFWDVAAGRDLARFDRGKALHSLAFSPDGNTLATGGEEKTIRLWDVRSRREIGRLPGFHIGPDSMAYWPDGKRLAATCQPGTIALWDVAASKELRRFTISKGHRKWGLSNGYDWGSSVALLMQGRIIAAMNTAGQTIDWWDTSDGKLQRRTENTEPNNEYISLRASPDGRLLAVGEGFGTVRLLDADKGQVVRSLKRDQADPIPTALVRFTADSKLVAAAFPEPEIAIWDVQSGEQVLRLRRQQLTQAAGDLCVCLMAFSPDGRMLATSCGDEDVIRVWTIPDGKLLGQLKGQGNAIVTLAFAPDGKTLASGNEDATVLLWDVTGLAKKYGMIYLTDPISGRIIKADKEKSDACQESTDRHRR